jgi:hypothetical protein
LLLVLLLPALQRRAWVLQVLQWVSLLPLVSALQVSVPQVSQRVSARVWMLRPALQRRAWVLQVLQWVSLLPLVSARAWASLPVSAQASPDLMHPWVRQPS